MHSRKYCKMLKTYRKSLKKIAKECRPWDYGWSIDFLIEHLKFMRDYYALGENIIGMEDKEWKPEEKYTCLEMINQILAAYQEFNDYSPDFSQIEHMSEAEKKIWLEQSKNEYLTLKHKVYNLLEQNLSKLWD